MAWSEAALPTWEADKAVVCARIADNPGAFKILLKTKDDPFFLRRWLRHHAKIVGLKNLIVFDNMSTDPEVLSVYEKHSSDLFVIRFGGMHNLVHDTTKFPELYSALANGCEYFVFLDTDEYLVLFNRDSWRDSTSLMEFIGRNRETPVFPGTWLFNAAGTENKFMIGSDFAHLSDGLKWGKPILRSTAPIHGFINHNGQLDRSLYGPQIPTNFFVLHLVQLSGPQRIRANYLKLLSRKFISADEPLEDVAARDLSGVTDRNILLYVSEIKRLLRASNDPPVDAGLPAGCIELVGNGSITYHSEAQREILAEFLANSSDVVGRVLELPNRPGDATAAHAGQQAPAS